MYEAKKVIMGTVVQCPMCGSMDLDVHTFESMMMLDHQLAYVTLNCPRCHTLVSTVCVVPPDIAAQAAYVARKLGAGMGSQTPSR